MKFVDWVKGWQLWAVVVVAGVCVFGAIRFFDDTTETWNIQNKIAGEMREQADLEYDELAVDCPDEVEWEPNEEFHCIAEASDGSTVRVTVHMESGDGDYLWAVE